ncbi:PAS domain-containing sensor histidine kinase [Megalodesulfovibrio gigas]|uniref:histidine kinase n=1 Tax=Megalodesulfovibrio gigas (strain ATCC 19364 / DSM 1382 / NCIMB 9332 / VKM B-1759) TaxID=1121448 RepID=T2GAG1_MEGG1|nr:PAS domain-containing sensor histidine kinase [Megalodesulfovibrio gigas]AGW13101.1 putative PAS/PAC sensor signal transduction histidine kinase [Megalodesulfovibrio gigas DSM 1382 = ATCC 19364]
MSAARAHTGDRFDTLRQRAEAALDRIEAASRLEEAGDVRVLMHELSIYQVELEMQNEELRHAQQELEAARRLSDALLATSPTGIMLVDANGVILRTNKATSMLLGLERTHLEGQRFGVFLDPDSLFEFQELLAVALEGGPARPRELRLRRLGGLRFHARMDCSALDLQDLQAAAVPQAVCTFQDISDTVALREALRSENQSLDHQLRRRAQELEEINRRLVELLDQYEAARQQAEAAQRAKTSFLRNMSHELRTPLHGLMSLTEILLATVREPQDRELVDMARAGVAGLVELFQDLLDLAAMEADALEMLPADVAPELVLDAVCQSMAPVARAKGLRLDWAVDPTGNGSLACIRTDAVRLKQALLALLGNAVKFTPPGAGAVVCASCRQAADGLVFVIEDTGPGIPSPQLGQVCGLFVQGDDSLTRAHGGLGAGLSMACRLVGLLGGTLTLDNRPEGGLRATVRLPAAPCCGETPR